jgi:hypothetical protein
MPAALRRWLGGAIAVLAVIGLSLLVGGASVDYRLEPEPVSVSAHALPHFRRGDAQTRRFGALEYIGGLELSSRHRGFGGISAIRVAKDGAAFLAATDTGDWLKGRIVYDGGVPAGIADATIAPLLAQDGQRTKDVGLWDSESIAVDGDTAFVGIERDHAVLAFDLGRDGLRAKGRRLPVPGFVADWPDNRGIEALGVMPDGSPYAGRLVGISERSGESDAPTEGFVMRKDGGEAFRFLLRRSERFDITDLDFLPSGDLVILERYFSPRRGVAMRLRRLRTADIRPGAMVDGEVLLKADGGSFHIDNMEGLSIHRNEAGDTIFTLASDDNFSIAQRTLLLQFRWLGD